MGFSRDGSIIPGLSPAAVLSLELQRRCGLASFQRFSALSMAPKQSGIEFIGVVLQVPILTNLMGQCYSK